MTEYVFQLFSCCNYYLYYILEYRVIDKKGEKEGAIGLSKPNVGCSILLPVEIEGNDAALPEREKFKTNHPFKKYTH